MPRWTKALLAAAGTVTVVGLALQAVAYVRGPGDEAETDLAERPQRASPSRAPAETFMGSDGGDVQPGAELQPQAQGAEAPGDGTPAALGDWAPAVTRLGFGFLAGFAIAFALRSFFKLAVVFLGLVVLVLLGLQYAGVIDVRWDAMGEHWAAARDWIARQAAGFYQFVTGYLPSAASGALGLVLGFRRH